MAPDPSVLGSDLILGPLGLLAFIVAALGYAAKEYRKARDARVEDLLAERERERAEHTAENLRLEAERDDARADRDGASRLVDARNLEIVHLKEQHMQDWNTLFARLIKAREMLVERNVAPEDLP